MSMSPVYSHLFPTMSVCPSIALQFFTRSLTQRIGREILQWLHNRPFRGLAPDANVGEESDVGLLPRAGLAVDAEEPEPPSGIQRAPRRRRAPSPAKHCCSNGCTKQDLLAFCPH
ncbi:insulin-like 3 isoform X2 [Antechinus flavipes]|uniref:insulin-like 3 isoform X2 n=1 Tax=Antechinus flavipes TaxID=38775 RepID=UPI002235B6B9|nr:insulin-like 3 isoform X2 [Antechinus flavipes]